MLPSGQKQAQMSILVEEGVIKLISAFFRSFAPVTNKTDFSKTNSLSKLLKSITSLHPAKQPERNTYRCKFTLLVV